MAIKLYYQVTGRGKPLILLHGNGESSDYFKNQIGFFSKFCQVIAVDTRGHGKSPRGAAPFTLVQFADDLKHLLDRLKITKADILGFSDGGNIALIFTLKYPDYTDRLILNSANLYPSGMRTFFQASVVIGYITAKLISLFSKQAAARSEMLGLMANEPHISAQELHKINSKTLIIAGTVDLIKKKHTLLIAESIPDSKVVFIKGSHAVAKENPKEFNKAVIDFLQYR